MDMYKEIEQLRSTLKMAEHFVYQATQILHQLEEKQFDEQDKNLNKFLYNKTTYVR